MSTSIKSLMKKLPEIVEEGVVYEVGHPHQAGIPHHPSHPPFLYSMARLHNDLHYKHGVSSANDIFTTGTHTGTHIDAIGHISCEGKLYDDVLVEDTQDKIYGLKKHGIDTTKPIIKNCILLDIAKYKGVSCLDAGYAIGAEDLAGAMRKQEVKINKGDAVLIRTGWGQHYSKPNKFLSITEGTPGINEEGAEWLLNQGMNLAGGDTITFEVTPTDSLAVHRMLLVDNGINIMEVLNLEELSKDNKYNFLFICLPLRIVGGTGSPIRPIAIC